MREVILFYNSFVKQPCWKENGQKASVRIQAFRMSELSEQAEARRVLDMKDLEI